MTYLYLSKLGDNYYVMNSSEIHIFKEPSSNYGLSCKLNSSYEELTLKVGGIYGKVAHQVLEPETLLEGCRAFKQEEANVKLNEMLAHYLSSLNQIELAILNLQVKEAENYLKSKDSYDSVILKNLAASQSINIDKLARNILDKAQEHALNLISFKCLKDHIKTKLETVNSLESFETFDIGNEITKYQNEIAEQKVLKTNDQLLVLQNECIKLPEKIEIILLESETGKDIKVTNKDLANDLTKLKGLKPLEKAASSTKRRNAQ